MSCTVNHEQLTSNFCTDCGAKIIKQEVKPVIEQPKEEVKPIVEQPKEEVKPIIEEEVKPIVEETKEEVKPIQEEVKSIVEQSPREEFKPIVKEETTPIEEQTKEEVKPIIEEKVKPIVDKEEQINELKRQLNEIVKEVRSETNVPAMFRSLPHQWTLFMEKIYKRNLVIPDNARFIITCDMNNEIFSWNDVCKVYPFLNDVDFEKCSYIDTYNDALKHSNFTATSFCKITNWLYANGKCENNKFRNDDLYLIQKYSEMDLFKTQKIDIYYLFNKNNVSEYNEFVKMMNAKSIENKRYFALYLLNEINK